MDGQRGKRFTRAFHGASRVQALRVQAPHERLETRHNPGVSPDAKASALRRSAGWLLLPPLLFNLALYDRLPPTFAAERFDADIPAWLLTSEMVLRIACFGLLFVGRLGLADPHQRVGAGLYLVGLGVYFASWWAHIAEPDGAWSSSLLGFTAPAWTASLWLGSALLMLEGPLFGSPQRLRELCGASALLFMVVHVAHAWLAHPGA